jgi:aspartate-semialdehyde dehydrogenase
MMFRVGILGATGVVGQRFVQLLERHPWFRVTAVAASDRSLGQLYGDACVWRVPSEMPAAVRQLVVQRPTPPLDCDIVFSSLPSDVAGEIECRFANAGYPVISNSAAHRMRDGVPLVIPEVNAEHLALLDGLTAPGFIVANPNCVAVMVALALAPLHREFGVSAAVVTTLQALSGAGYPGVAASDITDNVIPFIAGEEEKIEGETRKILGSIKGATVESAAIALSAQCHRVGVLDGHMAAIRVKLAKATTLGDVRAVLESFTGPADVAGLPSVPERPIVVRSEPDRPQPRLDRDCGAGMTVSIGRLATDTVLDFKFVALSHNTIRGAAGAALLNAELLAARGYLRPGSLTLAERAVSL